MNVFEKILEKLEENKRTYAKLQLGTNRNSEKIAYCGKEQAINIAISIVKEAEKEHNNGWIPCSERLPEEFEATDYIEQMIYEGKVTEYIVMIQGAKKATTLYYAGDGYWYDEVSQEYYDVIAWKPLPEPYKESEDK